MESVGHITYPLKDTEGLSGITVVHKSLNWFLLLVNIVQKQILVYTVEGRSVKHVSHLVTLKSMDFNQADVAASTHLLL